MNFVDAIRQSTWVRRYRWASWICIKDGDISKYLENVTRDDLLADDWIPYQYEDDEVDSSSLRFALLELD